MKQIITATFAFLLLFGTATAQKSKHCNGGNGKKIGKGQKHEFVEKLNLTNTQKAKAKELKTIFHTEMKELNRNKSITVGEMETRRAKIKTQYKANMQSILTSEQKAKIDQIKVINKKQKEENAVNKIEKLKNKIVLTDAQMTTINASKEKVKKELELIQNSKIEDEVKKIKIRELKKAAKEDFKNVLTNEQKIKLTDLKKNKNKQGITSK